MSRSLRSTPLCLALAAAGLAAAPLAAQDTLGVRFGVGYTANAPEMLAGASGFVILPAMGGIGLYLDAKFNPDSPRKDGAFLEGRTALQIEDEVAGVRFQDSKDSYRSFNVAVVRPMTPSMMLYAGAGISQMTRYREYFDPTEEMGLIGFFWVEAPDEKSTSINGLAGAFLRISSLISFQTGFETNPKGFTVGATFHLPRR
jgi:hypothetical protein